MVPIFVVMDNHSTDRKYNHDGSSKRNSSDSCFINTLKVSFEPQGDKTSRARVEIFDEKIMSLHAEGLKVRDIQTKLLHLYGMEISTILISKVTKALTEKSDR